jgi:hypothetical protein
VALAGDALLVAAAAVAGAVNSVAGGGTLLSFPAAMAWGLSSNVANATNTVAMAPGGLSSAWAYRRELAGARPLVGLLALPAIVGGLVGAVILRHTPARVFDRIVPWLVLGATLIMLAQARLRREKREGAVGAPAGRAFADAGWRPRAAAVFLELLVGVYGGYFGGAVGIVTLALLSLVAGGDMQTKNAVKNLLTALINGVASVYFIAVRLVNGRAAVLMIGGAVAGGLVGAMLARRASARVIRGIVIAIGLSLSALLGYRAYRG